MTKEQAKDLIKEYLSKNDFPIIDAVVYNRISFNIPQSINESYTFKGLLCIAYDLQEKPK
jgi:hypothetical protein